MSRRQKGGHLTLSLTADGFGERWYRMAIIVDGYNFIGRSRRLKIENPDCREKLIRDLTEYCRLRKKEITIVFDGAYLGHIVNKKRTYGRITIVYSSGGSSADEEIGKLIRANQRKKQLLIVTSDNEVRHYAKSMGTRVVRSEEFEREMERTFKQKNRQKIKKFQQNPLRQRRLDRVHVHLSAAEIQEWLEVFGEK